MSGRTVTRSRTATGAHPSTDYSASVAKAGYRYDNLSQHQSNREIFYVDWNDCGDNTADYARSNTSADGGETATCAHIKSDVIQNGGAHCAAHS